MLSTVKWYYKFSSAYFYNSFDLLLGNLFTLHIVTAGNGTVSISCSLDWKETITGTLSFRSQTSEIR